MESGIRYLTAFAYKDFRAIKEQSKIQLPTLIAKKQIRTMNGQ